MTRFIYIVVVLLASLALFVSCNSISSTNYEQHGLYYKGRLLPSVSDKRLAPAVRLFSASEPSRPDVQAAWAEHQHTATSVPRKFILDLWPHYAIVVVASIDAKDITPIINELDPVTEGNKTIGQVEIILSQKGRYIINCYGKFYLFNH